MIKKGKATPGQQVMFKFLLECALFALILCQINTLAGRSYNSEMPQPAVTIEQSIAANALPHLTSEEAKALAMREAERIIETDDIKSFENQLRQHSGALGMTGFRL